MSKRSKRRMSSNSSDSSESEVEERKKKRKMSESEESTISEKEEVSEKEEESEAESIPKEKITLKIKKDRIKPPQEEEEDEDGSSVENSSKNENSNSDVVESEKGKHIKGNEENGVSDDNVEKVNGTTEKNDEDKENTETQENGKESIVEEEVTKKPMIRLVPLTSLLKAPAQTKIEDVVCLSSSSEEGHKENLIKKKANSKKQPVSSVSSSEDEASEPTKSKKKSKTKKSKIDSDDSSVHESVATKKAKKPKGNTSSGEDEDMEPTKSKKKSKTKKSKIDSDDSSSHESIVKSKKNSKNKKTKIDSDDSSSVQELAATKKKADAKKPQKPIEAMTTEEILSTFFKQKCKVRVKKEDMRKLAKKSLEKRKKAEERRNQPGTSKTVFSSDSESDVVTQKKKVEMSKNSKKRNKIADSDSNNVSESDSYQSDDSMSSMEVLPSKNRKRIVKPKDSSDENDDEYGDAKAPAKVTKKKKKKKGSSDSSGDEDEDEQARTKRKNIRKLIKTKDLETGTKAAAKEEEERRKRIEERQKKYNEIYEKPESVELDELILDFDDETNEPLLQVDKNLIKLLKPHQAKGVKFMWDACFETVKDAKEKPGSGCILAHCMGLGKTLQIVTLTHTLITNQKVTDVERALIISPLSTLNNWAREFQMWMKHCKNRNIEVYDMSRFKDKATRIYKLQEWYEEGGVCIMGYDMYRIFSNEKAKGLKKKQRETLVNSLVDPGPDIVVCDEGHLLKNEKTSISKAVTKMRTRRRIVLTGTPLQNNLKEYYCMIQFIKPNLLGTYKEYLNRFVNPITNGQYADSTVYDMRLMKHRSHILHKLLEGCIQRRDYSVLAPYLPPKHEYVVYVTLSDIQKVVYEFYMREQRRLMSQDSQSKGATLFQDFQNLRRIWTHPMCLRVNSDILIQKKLMADDDEEGSLKDFIDDDTSAESSAASSDDEDAASSASSKKPTKTTRNNAKKGPPEFIEDLGPKEDASEWWMKMVPDEELNNINNSPKLVILFELLRECAEIGDKILVFSQSLQSLDVIEHFLSMIDQKTQGEDIDGNVGDFRGSWQPNVDYFRLDGSRSVDNREAMCKVFNDKNNLRARLFLISTRAGGLGINLVAANRVVIFDVSWNPSHDTQSIFRVYRFGQDKPCYIYRLLAMGTMEQKVYERQVTKQATAKRVIDEQQISRHYNQNDLQELYTYELDPITEREVPILPKDKLFAELLSHKDKMIFKYHEHDSLLENEVSENLTEEERKAAWSEYEAEKSRPTTAASYIGYNRQAYGNYGTTGPVTTNKVFGFRTDVLLRLLNLKAQKDNPMIPIESTGNLIPLYMQRLNAEMNSGNPTMYKELLELHAELETPYMNPLLYANQNPVFSYPMAVPQIPQYQTLPQTTETIEILDD